MLCISHNLYCYHALVQCPVCGSHLTALKLLKEEVNGSKVLREQLENATVKAQECSELKFQEKEMCVIDSVQYDHGDFAKTRSGEVCLCQVSLLFHKFSNFIQ